MSNFIWSVLAMIAIGLQASPAFAEDGLSETLRSPLFVCRVGLEQGKGILLLDGIEHEDGTWTDLQFRGQGSDLPPLLFPPKPGPGKGNFFFSHSDGDGGYLVNVRFESGGYSYRLYSLRTPPEPGNDDIGGGAAGLEITMSDGRRRDVECSEVPYMFVSYMQDAMSCDQDDLYGAAACNTKDVPMRALGVGPPND